MIGSVQNVAASVRALAMDQHHLSHAEILCALADALEDPLERPRWADIDVGPLFAPPVEPIGTSKLERWRNALVFAPVLVTWLGVADAMRGLDRLASQDEQRAAAPFLRLWQAGFDGNSFFSLGTIAAFDALAVFIVLVLTFLLGKRHASSAQADSTRLWNRQRLAELHVYCQVALRSGVVASPQDLQREFATAVASLNQLKDAARVATAMARNLHVLEQAAASFQASAGGLTSLVNELRSDISVLALELGRVVLSQDATAQSLSSALSSLDRGGGAVTIAAQELGEFAAQLRPQQDAARDTLASHVELMDAARLAANGAIDDIAKIGVASSEFVTGLGNTIEELRSVASQFQIVVDTNKSVTAAQRKALAQVSKLASTAAVAVGHIQEELKHSVERAR